MPGIIHPEADPDDTECPQDDTPAPVMRRVSARRNIELTSGPVEACEEAKRHSTRVEAASGKLRSCHPGTPEYEFWQGDQKYYQDALHNSQKAHAEGKCSCYMRKRVEAARRRDAISS